MRESDHGFAGQIRIHIFAERFDYARNFVPHYTRLGWSIRIQALPGENIGEIEPGSAYSNYNLAFPWRRVRLFQHFQNIHVAILCGDNLSHASP